MSHSLATRCRRFRKPQCASQVSDLAPHQPSDGSSLLIWILQHSNYPIFKATMQPCHTFACLNIPSPFAQRRNVAGKKCPRGASVLAFGVKPQVPSLL